MKSLLYADNITCSRGDKILFKNLCMELQVGEILQIVGPNGAGKTSLLQILSGLLAPQNGHVFWKQQPIQSNLHDYFQSIFYLGHQRGIKMQLSVFENLMLDCRYAPLKKEIVSNAIKIMKLDGYEKTHCANLSEGQCQRAALAKLLIIERPIWILDEPLNSLDQSGVKLFENLLVSQIREKGSVIISTHRPLNLFNINLRTFNL